MGSTSLRAKRSYYGKGISKVWLTAFKWPITT
jgi:hypothetical protein